MDDLSRLLLARVAGVEDAAVPLSLSDLVQQSLGDDPLALPLAAALRRREVETNETDGEPDPEVLDVMERLYGEVEALRDRVRMLAAALGACARCFGDDELCPVCLGRGRPGGRQPDELLFAELVEPAWQRHVGIWSDDPDLVAEHDHQP